jgi:hypothetical protein
MGSAMPLRTSQKDGVRADAVLAGGLFWWQNIPVRLESKIDASARSTLDLMADSEITPAIRRPMMDARQIEALLRHL